MCRILRDFILRKIDKQYETVNNKQQIQIPETQIMQWLNEFNQYQNYKHKVIEYKKPPIDITEDDVEVRN